MSSYWAKFETVDQYTFRFDTRIYLTPVTVPEKRDFCIGAVVGKNPGSAQASSLTEPELHPICLNGDKLLPTVRNLLLKAYEYKGTDIPGRAYIQVLNLFYLCNPHLNDAIKAYGRIQQSKICQSESKFFPWAWYVWGGENVHLSPYKTRFQRLKTQHSFFYDKTTATIKRTAPAATDFAKHTQGLKHDDVIPHLAALL